MPTAINQFRKISRHDKKYYLILSYSKISKKKELKTVGFDTIYRERDNIGGEMDSIELL